MEKNFTSLDTFALEKRYAKKEDSIKQFDINSIFLGLIVITLVILSVLLYILIQKKMEELALTGFIA